MQIDCARRLASVWLVSLLVAACGGSGGDIDAPGIPNAERLPGVASVSARSVHYVAVSFTEPPDPVVAGNRANYRVALPEGDTADVAAARPGPGDADLLLELDFTRTTDGPPAPGENLTFDLVGLDDTPVPFAADATEEPAVTSAASIGSETVRVVFSEPVTRSAGTTHHYAITDADGASLDVVAAEMDASGAGVVLTTATQDDATYVLTVDRYGINGVINGLPLDPTSARSTFTGISQGSGTALAPRVVSAASIDNTRVKVTFNKPMGPGAEEATNYAIVQENINPEAGSLGVVAAEFSDASQSAVVLTTRSQNELTYRVTVVDLRDTFGQPIDVSTVRDGFATAATSTFAGTPPGAGDLVDSDDDGLYDNEEQSGYVVVIEMANGSTVTPA